MSSDDSRIYTLSDFYPENTIYFYGFPAGESLHFFNLVPLEKEEIVAARPFVCSGDKMQVVCYPSAVDHEVRELLTEHLHVSLLSSDKIITLPPDLHTIPDKKDRNLVMQKALLEITKNGKFIMAQPFIDEDLNSHYLIDSKITIAMNDKIKRSLWVPEKYLPESYQKFSCGKDFAADNTIPPLPCVVKVSSSSAGDGVRICFTKEEFEIAKKDFSKLKVKIMTEKFIHAVHNLGIQIGIPYDNGEPQIIGFSQQFVDAEGNYLGGVIDPSKKISIIEKITKILRNEILPNVRKLGWFGIGGIDILVDKDDNIYLIDPNFRMTAFTSFIFLNKNKQFNRSLISFMGDFEGSKDDFIKKVVPIAQNDNDDSLLKVVALTKRKNSFGINAGIFFNGQKDLYKTCNYLASLGLKGRTLEKILHSKSLTL